MLSHPDTHVESADDRRQRLSRSAGILPAQCRAGAMAHSWCNVTSEGGQAQRASVGRQDAGATGEAYLRQVWQHLAAEALQRFDVAETEDQMADAKLDKVRQLIDDLLRCAADDMQG